MIPTVCNPSMIASPIDGLPWAYDKISICHFCEASDCETELSYANADEHAPWTVTPRQPSEFQRFIDSGMYRCPLLGLDGFTIHQVWFESMHADLIGLRLHLNASTLMKLCEEGCPVPAPPRGDWKSRANAQLDVLSTMFRSFLRTSGEKCTARNFNLNTLRVAAKHDWSEMRAKARNSAVISMFLRDVHEKLEHRSEHAEFRLLTLWGFTEYFALCNSKTIWLDSDQLDALKVIRECMLQGYHWLSRDASLNSEARFSMRPKFHALDELCRMALRSRLNPGSYWAFGGEDFAGRIGKIASAVHPSRMDSRTAERWMICFFSQARS